MENPFAETPHTDLSGTINLTSDLVHFTTNSENNYRAYIPHIIKGEKYKSNPICVTSEKNNEMEKIENLTMAEIKHKIFELISLMENDEKKLYNEYFQK